MNWNAFGHGLNRIYSAVCVGAPHCFCVWTPQLFTLLTNQIIALFTVDWVCWCGRTSSLQTFACLLWLRSKSSRGQFCSADERMLTWCITSPLWRSEPSFLILFFSYNDDKTAGRFSGSLCAYLPISTLSHSAQPNKKVGGRPSTCSDYFLFCMYPCVCVYL